MKMIVPITGTVLEFSPELAKLDDVGISGDPNDPVRIINLNLGNVSWKLISIDLENDEAEIEVTPSEMISEDTGQVDDEGEPIYEPKTATAQDQQRFLDEAEAKVIGKTLVVRNLSLVCLPHNY